MLIVGNRYPNQADILWNLPGGRQEYGELLGQALEREVREETGLAIALDALAYVSESYDQSTTTHFTNYTFHISSAGEPRLIAGDAHVVAIEWAPFSELALRFAVKVVREPLLAHLAGSPQRYWGYADAGITIEFADEGPPQAPTSAN